MESSFFFNFMNSLNPPGLADTDYVFLSYRFNVLVSYVSSAEAFSIIF